MKHPILISVINDANGIPASADGVMGLFCKAQAVSSTFLLDTAYLLTQFSDLAALGINEQYDFDNRLAVYQQVQEFYEQAGEGAYLWLFGVDTQVAFSTYVAGDVFKNLVRTTAIADPLNRVKMVGFCYEVPTSFQTSNPFPSDVTSSISAFKAAQSVLFNQGYQMSAIIDGYRMSPSLNPSTLPTMADKSAYSVSLCITGKKPNGVSAVGAALGRFARISVGQGFGAVEDGPVVADEAFLTNCIALSSSEDLIAGQLYTVWGGPIIYIGESISPGQSFIAQEGELNFDSFDSNTFCIANMKKVEDLTPAYVDALGTKQYMFLRKWIGLGGYFWNDGATCEDPARQLSTQEYNRVANKLSSNALSFFIQQMGKNLPLDIKTGSVEPAYLLSKEQEFKDAYIDPLSVNNGGTGDMTDGLLTLSAPNFNSTKRMNFSLKIVPTPILGSVEGTVQFTSTI